MPILSILRATVKPLADIGTQLRDLLRCGAPSRVLARRQIQSAWAPLVIHILLPWIT